MRQRITVEVDPTVRHVVSGEEVACGVQPRRPGSGTIVTGAVIGSKLPASTRTQSVGHRQRPHRRIRARLHDAEAVPDARTLDPTARQKRRTGPIERAPISCRPIRRSGRVLRNSVRDPDAHGGDGYRARAAPLAGRDDLVWGVSSENPGCPAR
jgi:hypothetical protein